jgi:hypothetical protein
MNSPGRPDRDNRVELRRGCLEQARGRHMRLTVLGCITVVQCIKSKSFYREDPWELYDTK